MDINREKEHFENDLLFVNMEAVKPKVKGFKYHEPTDVKPEHIPDKELFKEEHKFYDVDMNVVKENTKKGHDFSQKMGFDEFQEHEEFMRMIRDYYNR